jgi:uncharacterized membrane protein YedE/YeeE
VSAELWPWWLGGLGVGFVAAAYPLFSGRLLGVSSVYATLFERRSKVPVPDSALEQALLEETEAEFGPDSLARSESRSHAALGRLRGDSERFRPLFLVGMVAGAAVVSASSDQWQVSLSLGSRFDARYGEFGLVALAVLLGSGVLIGFGTRLGAGCTSGHGVSGVARGQPGSLVTTAVFWGTALAVTWSLTVLAGALR